MPGGDPALPDTDTHPQLDHSRPGSVPQGTRVYNLAHDQGPRFSLVFNFNTRFGIVSLGPPRPCRFRERALRSRSLGYHIPHQPRLETRPVRCDRTIFHSFHRHR